MIFKYALRELLRNWKFAIFFIFNLSLGLAGYITVQSFNVSLTNEIRENSKAILSADLAVTARREFTDQEKEILKNTIPKDVEKGQVYEFFAMMNAFDKGTRLVLVKGVDASYPLYGEFILKNAEGEPQAESVKSPLSLIGQKNIWIYPELQDQLGLKVGDKVQLGNLDLTVSEVVDKDATQTFRMGSLAPKIYIDQGLLSQTGLLQFGSTFSVVYLYKFKSPATVNEIQDKIYSQIQDPQVRVETPESAGEDSGRQLGYLTDYLGLVAIVAIFLSAIGGAYLYRMYLSTRMKEIAIYRTLGLQSSTAVGIYILQASLLGLLAVVPTLALAQIALPLFSKLLSGFTSVSIAPTISMESIWVCILMAVVGSFSISLPYIIRIYELRPSKLFNEEKFSSQSARGNIIPYLPAIILFSILSIYQAHSFKVGGLFILTMVVVIALLSGLGYLVIRSASIFKNLKKWSLRFSFLSLSRRSSSSLAVFVALGIGTLLMNILPQIESSLQQEFKVDSGSKIPSLFMFDIQDDQIGKLEEYIHGHDLNLISKSPMVRARILKVNDKDYERDIGKEGFKTREEEQDARFRNRGINLSFREKLSDSEFIVSGKEFSGVYKSDLEKLPELSVEKRYAERMGLNLGDKVLFDIQGVEMIGEIVNFRKVRWTSFQPNFFILFQPGVLEEAPKTWLAALPSMEMTARSSIQSDIVKLFPNVSIIDVVRTVENALEVAKKMSWSLELMAVLALVTGYIVLYSIIRTQIRMRRWELNMLKVLGAHRKDIYRFIMSEVFYLAFAASFLGAGFSVFASIILNTFLFETDFVLNWVQPAGSVLIITFLSLIVSVFAATSVVNESPLVILKEER